MSKPNSNSELLTYAQALPLFQAASICNEVRTVRRHIWANPSLCPVVSDGYHYRRVRRGDVRRLVAKIERERWPDETTMPAKGGGR